MTEQEQYPAYRVEIISPDTARELLTYNTHNRNIRGRVIAAYAVDMAAGNWRENGESIKLAKDGTVLDGQHRLHAIIESDTSQRMLVVRGLPMETQETVDGGAKRKFADVLKLRKETRYISIAALARGVHLWQIGHRGRGTGRYVPTTSQLLATLDEFPDIRYSAEVIDSVHLHIPIHKSILGLCHWLFNRIDADDCAFFFDRLKDGAGLMANDPIAVLRRTVIDNMHERSRLSGTVVLAYVIKAWNAYREGREIALLKYRQGGAKPEQFPEPK